MSKIPSGAMRALASALAAVGMLSACGGGGGGDAQAVAPKQFDFSAYEGTWSICQLYRSDYSARYQVVVSQVSSGRFHYDWQETDHATPDCSGAGTVTYSEQGDAVALGETVMVDGIEAQKLTVTGQRDSETGGMDPFTEIQVVALTAKGLFNGGPRDVDGNGVMHFSPETVTRPETQLPPPASAASPTPSASPTPVATPTGA